jgi:hypothetical protein
VALELRLNRKRNPVISNIRQQRVTRMRRPYSKREGVRCIPDHKRVVAIRNWETTTRSPLLVMTSAIQVGDGKGHCMASRRPPGARKLC